MRLLINHKISFFLLVLFALCRNAVALPDSFVEHFSEEHGLEQSSILKIIQDRKGFLWLGTFDGLIRYDGYRFQAVRPSSSQAVQLKSNRINNLQEDRFGRLWLQSNQSEVYCYQPSLEKFWLLHDAMPDFQVSEIRVMPSGKVWLLSEDAKAVCIRDSLFNLSVYGDAEGKLKWKRIFDIREDFQQNTWFLTDEGLQFIDRDGVGEPAHSYELKGQVQSINAVLRCSAENEQSIWFAGEGGQIWRYDKRDRVFFKINSENQSTIIGARWLQQGCILFTTSENGFFIYDINKGEFKNFGKQFRNKVDMSGLRVLYVDSLNRELWFSNAQPGIYRFQFEVEKLTAFLANQDKPVVQTQRSIPLVLNDQEGNLWIQPKNGGLYFYDRATDKMVEDIARNKVLRNVDYTFFVDQQDNLWFSSRNQGLQKLSFARQKMRKLQLPVSQTGANNVRALAEDLNGNIWVATKDESRLAIFDAEQQLIGYLSPQGEYVDEEHSLWKSAIYCILQDKDGTVWLGTRGEGIYHFVPDTKSGAYRVSKFDSESGGQYSLNDDDVYCMLQDSSGRIWVGTWGGGLNLLEKDGREIRFLNIRNELLNYPEDDYSWVRWMTLTKNNELQVATTNGLVSLKITGKSAADLPFKQYADFPNHDILYVYEAENGNLFLATYGGNLYRQSAQTVDGFPAQFESYSAQTTSLIGGITGIQEDDSGRIWICSERNLVRYDPETESFETFAEVKTVVGENLFSESAVCKLRNGELLFGFSDGILQLNPDNVGVSDFKPYLALTGFELMNNVPDSSRLSVLDYSVDDRSTIVLKHNQNFLKLQFAALDFSARKNIQYRYKLDGLEESWNYTGAERTATYTNLSHGDYQFRVSSTNGNGVWVDNERRLQIKIKPSVWETKLAYAIYFILFLGLFVLIQKTILTIFKLRNEMAMQQKMADLKLRFFTDISHEIRTPLTMIAAPVEKMVNDQNTPEPIRKQLSVVEQSTQRLLKLINQILDLRKFQTHRLQVEQLDLNQLVKQVAVEFEELAISKKIKLTIVESESPVRIWGDKEMIDKMLVNLVSNALKYCPAGSAVKLTAEETDRSAIIRIEDNGPGISVEKQKKLFVRFSNFNENPDNPSTGIGLSLVKDFADQHGAKIQLDSKVGDGTKVAISFQKGHSHFGSDVDLVSPQRENAQAVDENLTAEKVLPAKAEKRANPIGLLVEDDPELRHFMKSLLDEEDYTIYEAGDGEEGLQLALQHNPDFIVSDIMMPKMDGIELLKRLRNDESTSHIPIVLLSAKTDAESKLSGLTHGADDYLTKPFSVGYFKARIANLMEQRRRLQAFYKQPDFMPETDEELMPLSTKDQEFMEELVKYIIDHMEDPEFSVEELGKQVNLSKTTFFNKLKSLTGSSPIEFIREIRLSQAAKILAEENVLVKEACYQVGFSDLKYFGKCFKAKYNLTPAEYRKKYRQVRK
ncbi:hybrid sensor histidine kinase/response regulator transcription factor [Mangrovibacterium diazotrophicum]|uniref:histidine kinase n=1 Tax=Mangrovibacterium diazotrophicum TaxID=1261403 RepID=A0A419W4D3_9BACT|nr:two-component regulator propeller domain-containing protein [Mangrovibacterium diazotrophicum]RKD90313.1 two component regulator with propeller domain [Mangrovibacterium diazotrophicum]